MFGATPKSGKAELCVGIEQGFFERAFLWMVELANEGIVQAGLPFLDEGYFKTAVVHSVGIDGDRSPNMQIVMFMPIAQGQFSLDQSLMGELEVFKGVMHCRAQVELGLHVLNVGKPDVYALRLEDLSGEQVV